MNLAECISATKALPVHGGRALQNNSGRRCSSDQGGQKSFLEIKLIMEIRGP
ncbi:uncharacterized protein METZ01_LOCUS323604 [marine metagenome]|uniref:Uncharacterized protein n=1 Tax=marine metagenome TaxID=408172 RepID=A0A382PD48_9ZZZZ